MRQRAVWRRKMLVSGCKAPSSGYPLPSNLERLRRRRRVASLRAPGRLVSLVLLERNLKLVALMPWLVISRRKRNWRFRKPSRGRLWRRLLRRLIWRVVVN